ncbi:hypothetical protein [Mucisphaera sp.]|uniref:hypothetical protein n=1 Tax=Mucisphaera sp. TaxID=2913024 RepID=UPI003D120AAE
MIGVVAASIPILVGLLFRNRLCTETGLWMLVVFGWSIAAVMSTGETATELAHQGLGIAPYLDEAAWEIMQKHYDDAETYAKVVYLAALLGTLGVLARWFKPQWQHYIAWPGAIIAILSLPGMIYVANTGGQIRHEEFRPKSTTPIEQTSQTQQSEETTARPGDGELDVTDD